MESETVMVEDKRPEVNLELLSGFFRIPTHDVIYNIKVLDSPESNTIKVIEKIVEVEKAVAQANTKPAPPPEPTPSPPSAQPKAMPADNYYQQAAIKFCAELRQYKSPDFDSKQRNITINGLNDLAEMANELKEVLASVKEEASLTAPNGGSNNMTASLESLSNKIAQAKKLAGDSTDEIAPATEAEEEITPAAAEKVTRYLFNFDAVFQTIYELCTNETVKEHIQKARAKADDIFDKEKFYDTISPTAANLKEDDGFLSVPMNDIFESLSTACSDKATINLLKKMNQQQGDIFLDTSLPLEIPPTEEVEIPGATIPDTAPPTPTKKTPPASSEKGDIAALLDEIQIELASLSTTEQTIDLAVNNNPTDFTDGIDNAINIAASINCDAEQIAKAADIETKFRWLPIGATVIFMENLLAQKDGDQNLSFDEGSLKALAIAKEFKSQETEKLEAALTPEEEQSDDDSDNSADASQDEIDRLLKEMG